MDLAEEKRTLEHAVDTLRKLAKEPPAIALVLGSGLGAFGDTLAERQVLSYAQIPGMSASRVAGHAGQLVLGKLGGRSVVAMQGRVHLYEGHPAERVVFGVRLMIALGARTLIVTNAAGGIRADLGPGTLMLIEDHLNLTGRSPLSGENDESLGPRFPDMSEAYDRELLDTTTRVAARLGVTVARGVYAGLLGPSYETPAEIRMLRTLGADAVGMSTVLETIAARHMGARCLGISCITNHAAGLGQAVLSHDEVQEIAKQNAARFAALLRATIEEIAP